MNKNAINVNFYLEINNLYLLLNYDNNYIILTYKHIIFYYV